MKQIKFSADALVKMLEKKKEATLVEICNSFDKSPKAVLDMIRYLKRKHIAFSVHDDTIGLATELKMVEKPLVINFRKHAEIEYPIGFVTDNHIGSKYERMDVLNALYDRFQSYGIETVYNAGNIIDGECRFNKYDIYVHGIEDQVANLLGKYPQRDGIKTLFITGDDHEGWYTQREHIDVGKKIESDARNMGRKDLIHLGYMERDIEYKQSGGSSIIRVIHPGGGTAYALSYSVQKIAESYQGGEKPQIVLVGHFHKFDYSYPREIHFVQGGTTCDQTPFMRKKKIQAMVGGVVLWVKQSVTGIFTSVKIEWIPFYDKRFYAYKW